MATLSCYLIREVSENEPVRDLTAALDLDDIGAGSVQRYGPVPGRNFEAALFVGQGPLGPPTWGSFLQSGFGPVPLPDLPSLGAVLVVRVPRDGTDRSLAFTFGSGRFLLRSDAWEHSFGMRAALNIIYEGDDGSLDASRLRSVDAKRVEENTVHTRRQANRRTPLETFDLDLRRDLLRAVDGRPIRPEAWGDRIGGSDPLHLNLEVKFAGLGDLCHRILDAYAREDYRVRFAWVDNIRVVSNPQEIARLERRVISDLRSRTIDDYDLAPPEIIDWGAVARFQFDLDRQRKPPVRRPEAHLAGFLAGLANKGQLADLDVPRLKRRHLWAVDADGNDCYRWPIWRCLDAQFELDGNAYLLDGGAFYHVATDYLQEVDRFIGELPEWQGGLPTADVQTPEGDYNLVAASSSPDYLLLDKRLVRAPERTSPIEVCDILTRQGTLIHVKKGRGASSLSHLFAQGAVSAELLVSDREFRENALLVIRDAEDDRATQTGDETFRGRFQVFDPASFAAAKHPVVYAIVDRWNGDALARKLPFFSKVNLRRSVERLERLGFRVLYRRVSAG